jgi:aminoglycoside phosphotransferase
MPRLIAAHPEVDAMLMQRVDGDAALRKLTDAADRQALADDFIDALWGLHAVDPRALPLGDLGPLDRVPALVRRELATWRAMFDETGRPDVLIELGFDWLQRHVPDTEVPAALVHGDAGPGNFLFQGPRLQALIDWELAHLGDPLEDLAWMSMRCVIEPFPDFAAQVRRYERRAGVPVDRARLDYHRVFVALRVSVVRHRAVGVDAGDSDLANSLISRLVNRRLLVESLQHVMGQPAVEAVIPAARAGAFLAEFDYLIDHLAAAGALSADPAVSDHIKRAARIAKLLRAEDAIGAACRDAALDDLARPLGRRPAGLADGDAALVQALRAGRTDAGEVLRCMALRTARETAVGTAAIGALARRSYPGLDESPP